MVEKIKFIEVELPIVNHKVDLIANKIEELDNRTVKLDLTRKLRGKNVEFIFKLKVEDGKLIVDPYRIFIFKFFIRRIMRKSIDYVEDSFSANCKNAQLKIKIFLITRKKVPRAVRKALREKAKEEIISEINKQTYEEFFGELLSSRFQKNLSLKLKKIYPLAFCDIVDSFVERKI